MTNRIELLNQNEEINQFHPVAEAIVAAEEAYETYLSNNFRFSATEYSNNIRLARAGDFYFVSTGPNKPYSHFDSLTSIKLYFTELYNLAAKENGADASWKAFWFKELSKL